MDTIWDRKSFEVGGHWPLWRGWKPPEWPRRTDKRKKSILFCILLRPIVLISVRTMHLLSVSI